MSPNLKDVGGAISEGFSPYVIEQQPIVLGKRRISSVLTMPRSEPRSPLKNNALKNAWSRANTNRPEELSEGSAIFRLQKRARSNNLDRNRGKACFGEMQARNCSSVDALRYFCTSREAAGLPQT